MRLILRLCLVWVVALLVGAAPGLAAEKVDLRVLYAGVPGSEREKDFVAFLKEHFREVKTGAWAKFDAGAAEGVDVVLLDWDGDGFKAPPVELGEAYSKPTVTIGVAGAMWSMQRGLKTGYT